MPKHAADRRLLERQIGHVQALLGEPPWADSIIPCATPAEQVIACALRLDMVQCQPHPLGDIIRADEQQAASLAYFRNNVLHLLALAAAAGGLPGQPQPAPAAAAAAREAIRGIYGLLRTELFLPWEAGDLDAAIERSEAALARRGLILTEAEVLRAPPPNSEASPELRQLGEIIRPMLERQFLTLALLQHHGSGSLTRTALEDATLLLAQRLAMLYEFNASEFPEKLLFANVIRNLVDAEILQVGDDGRLRFGSASRWRRRRPNCCWPPTCQHQLIASATPSPALTPP